MSIFSRLPALFLLVGLANAQPESQKVWQIGKFDESPVEFSAHVTGAVKFRVGTSDPGKDWPSRQMTGQPYQITFSLDNVSGSYSLRIGALIDQPRVPALRIDVNGHSGIFYLHPKLSYSRSDFSYAFDPHESQSALDIDIPASFLMQGKNNITVTCTDDPATPGGEKELGGISYDALSLERSAAKSDRAEKVDAEPTIFFRGAVGHLSEIVDVFVRFAHPWKPGGVDLELSGHHYRGNFAAGEFGEERISLEVPEWVGTVQGRIRVSPGSKHPAEVNLVAQRKWTIFVVPHTHLDVGYTDYQGKVAETQARVLTQADGLIQKHPDFRFSMDGSWNLQQLLETRPKSKRDEILDLIRTGKMAMPAQYCNLLTGYASLETLYRSLYDSKKFANQYHLPFEYANITDVPTY